MYVYSKITTWWWISEWLPPSLPSPFRLDRWQPTEKSQKHRLLVGGYFNVDNVLFLKLYVCLRDSQLHWGGPCLCKLVFSSGKRLVFVTTPKTTTLGYVLAKHQAFTQTELICFINCPILLPSGQFILPEAIRSLPSAVLGLMKSSLLNTEIYADLRAATAAFITARGGGGVTLSWMLIAPNMTRLSWIWGLFVCNLCSLRASSSLKTRYLSGVYWDIRVLKFVTNMELKAS